VRKEEKLKNMLEDWKEFKTSSLIEREFDLAFIENEKILTITGPSTAISPLNQIISGKTWRGLVQDRRIQSERSRGIACNPSNIDELAQTVSELLFMIPNIDGKRLRFPVDMDDSEVEPRSYTEVVP